MRTLYYPQYAYLSSAPKQEICSPVQGAPTTDSSRWLV